ncbi:MAG: hypothetical protein V3U82_05875 [Robiginitomaculum sp.]
MLTITTVVTAALFWPALRFPQKNSLVNFYWRGIWIYLGVISAVAGGQATAVLLGHDSAPFSEALLYALTVTFVVFVMFAWARLALKGLGHVAKKAKS